MIRALTLMVAVSQSANGLAAPTIARHQISLEAARTVASAAEARARDEKVEVTVVVLDPSGSPILIHKMDGAPMGSVPTAIGKARTAAAWGVPSGQFEQWLTAGGTRLLTLPDTIMIEGGLPISVDGNHVGAVGVSGGSSTQDAAIARAALATVGQTR